MQTATPTPTRLGPWPFIVFTGTLFGTGGLIAKGLLDDGFNPFTITWMPALIGAVVIYLIRRPRPTLAQVGAASVLGVMSTAAPALFFNFGFQRLPAGTASLLVALGPTITALIAHFVFADERFNGIKAAGLGAALLGVFVLSSGSGDGETSLAGVGFMVIGSLFGGTGAIFGRSFAVKYGAQDLISAQLMSAAVSVGLLALIGGQGVAPDGGWERWHVIALLGLGAVTLFGFGAMLKANEIGTTGQVSVIGYLVPVVGVVGGVLVFNDAVTTSVVLGGLLIFGSISLIAIGSKSRHSDASRWPNDPAERPS